MHPAKGKLPFGILLIRNSLSTTPIESQVRKEQKIMHKANRKRNISVTVRMNKSEYDDFQNKLKKSGLSQQAYIISAVLGATITPSDEIDVLKKISITFSDLERQLRGLATNVNQMAHVANGQGIIPTKSELENLSNQLSNYRKESENIWQSIRSLINQRKVMEQ